MNELQIFQNPEFGEIRTIEIEGEQYFVGKDIASALGYGNDRQALITNVDNEDKGVHSVDTLGGKQNMTLINESGLYSLILGSKLAEAKKFKRWVTHEVLPSIRKTGSYSLPKEVMEDIAMLRQQVSEVREILPAVGKYMQKVNKNVQTTKYFVLRNQKARKNSKWSKQTGMKVKALSEKLSIDEYRVLSGLYSEITDRYDINFNDFKADYCYVNNLDQCSTLSVVESNRELCNYFDSVLNEMLNRFGIYVDTSLPKRKTVFDQYDSENRMEVV